MDFNNDTGTIYGGIQEIDVSILPPLGGQSGVLRVIGTGALVLPSSDTAARPLTPEAGMIRFNSDVTGLEFYNGTLWSQLSVGGGTVTSVSANGSTGISVTGSPITSSGTLSFTLDTGLQNLATFSTTGLLVATGADTWASTTITGTAGNIAVTNGSGVSGSPTIDLASVTQAASGDFVKVTLDTKGRVSGNTPVVASDITSLVDGTYVNIAGDTMSSGANLTFVGGGEVLGLPATPSGDTAAASKAYVDSVAAGLSWKQSVVAATTGNITLSGTQTIDGVALSISDRVLVKSQTDGTENGIYVVASGAWSRSFDMDAITPINEINGAAVFVEGGTTLSDTAWVQTNDVSVIGVDPIAFTQFAGMGSYTAGTGLTLTGNVFSITAPVAVSLGGTGITTAPTSGQLLIGNGTGYTLSTLTAGAGISVTNGAGSISLANTGVTSLTGTANEVTVSASTGDVTIGLPDDVVIANSVSISTLSQNGAVYVGAAGELLSTAALVDGQILVGSTGNAPVATTITAGSGISVTNGAGSISISATNSGTVTSVNVSGGTTGLTASGGPITSSGTITLGGVLVPTNGGTGLSSLGSANQVLGVNAAGTSAEYKTITAGTGVSVVDAAGSITINNTGVTSVALSLPGIFSVTGSPVTTTGTLTATLTSQSANTVFSAPDGSSGLPTFRTLSYADLPILLYKENPSTPTAPVASGTNAVAVGSGSTASATGAYASGDGTNARIFGQKAYANGQFATAGDAQAGLYVLRNSTTNATFTELFLDGSAQRLVLPNNSVFTFDILVAGRRTDATGGGAAYRFVGAARKDATSGSITFIGTPSKTVIGETNNPWDSQISVDTVNGSLKVEARGEAAKTVRWVATVTTCEVTN